MQEATERIEQQADEVRQGIEQEARCTEQIEGNAGERSNLNILFRATQAT